MKKTWLLLVLVVALARWSAAGSLPPITTTIRFDGTDTAKWAAKEPSSVEEDGTGRLVLSSAYAVGAAAVLEEELPVKEEEEHIIKKNAAKAEQVRLQPDSYYLQGATLRITCGGAGSTTVATIRAYKESRDSGTVTTQAVLVGPSGQQKETDCAGLDIAGPIDLEVTIESGQATFTVSDGTNTFTVPAVASQEGEFKALRVQLSGNGPEGVRPSVEMVKAILFTKEPPPP